MAYRLGDKQLASKLIEEHLVRFPADRAYVLKLMAGT